MTFLIFVALIGLAISGGGFLAYQLILNFHPGPSRIRSELAKLMKTFDKLLPELVPIDKKELELLSHSQIKKEVRSGIAKTAKGVLVSIYEEPMIAYAYKRYSGNKENAALLIRTANQEIFYRIRHNQVQITANNQAIAVLESNGVLYSPGNYNPIAWIDKKSNQEAFPIFVSKKEVANLIREDKSIQVHQRALQFVTDLSPSEELILLILLSWELVRADLPHL